MAPTKETLPLPEPYNSLIDSVKLPKKQLLKKTNNEPWTVILTGSTGSMGTYILAALQALPETKLRRVYCLNRRENARESQIQSLVERGLPPFIVDARVSFIQASFGSPKFGLDEQTYLKLQDETTFIIHNAWPVNFLMTTADFQPHIQGVADMLRFSHGARKSPPLLFTSSYSTNYSAEGLPLEERVHHDPRLMPADGYMASKYVAERMMEAYVQSTGLSAGILRFGQVGGPAEHRQGFWPPKQWFPTMLFSAKTMGVLPATLGSFNEVNWIPLDAVAPITLEIAEDILSRMQLGNSTVKADPRGKLVYNIVNPTTVLWQQLLPILAEDISTQLVPIEEWVARLKQCGDAAGKLSQQNANLYRQNPAMRLINFYEAHFRPEILPQEFQISNLMAVSDTARRMEPVNTRWLMLWLEQWGLRRPATREKTDLHWMMEGTRAARL